MSGSDMREFLWKRRPSITASFYPDIASLIPATLLAVAPDAAVCYEARRAASKPAEAPMTDPFPRTPFYLDGMRELQDRFDGRRVADGLEKHRLHFEFWEQDRKLIEEARFFFIATSYQDNVDCSMRSGDPGFVRITGPDTLEYPEYDGNNMYRTLGDW